MFCDAYFRSVKYKDCGWNPEDKINILKKICETDFGNDLYLVENLDNGELNVVSQNTLIFFKNKDVYPCIPIKISEIVQSKSKMIFKGVYNGVNREYFLDLNKYTIFENMNNK